MKTTLFNSEIGKFVIVSKAEKLVKIDANINLYSEFVNCEFNNFVIKQIEEYLNVKRENFEIPIEISFGTVFQQKVWQEISLIPYGTTISYADLAKKIGVEKASRAVGNATGKNPVPIIIPCHRVISSTGKIGGFSLAIEVKKYLLKIEQKKIAKK
ncbi:MAG: methylated-DNA--[protein]-cysteine S-methyltransferase [Candidatus Gastranaerophilales bacterium]|nr:methylated-DNA--[protein]-cysteine S-methyltransferase [Candidatus Gastranaerophilales bacterium]